MQTIVVKTVTVQLVISFERIWAFVTVQQKSLDPHPYLRLNSALIAKTK